MQTLTELDRIDEQKRERAARYERVLNDLTRARKAVDQFEPKVEAITAVLKQLGALQELAATLPKDVTGTGDVILREQIFLSTAHAVKQLNNRRNKARESLALARADVMHLEDLIKEFEG